MKYIKAKISTLRILCSDNMTVLTDSFRPSFLDISLRGLNNLSNLNTLNTVKLSFTVMYEAIYKVN